MKILEHIVNGRCLDTEQANCLNLFFNRIDPVYVSYATSDMDIEKKDVHCQLDESDNYIKRDLNFLDGVSHLLSSLAGVADIYRYFIFKFGTNHDAVPSWS